MYPKCAKPDRSLLFSRDDHLFKIPRVVLTCLLPEKISVPTVMAHVAMEAVVGHKR